VGLARGDSPEITAADARIDLIRRLEALPPAERDVIVLAYFDDLTYQMAAERLGLPEGTAKSRIRSGLAHLRSCPELSRSSPSLLSGEESLTTGWTLPRLESAKPGSAGCRLPAPPSN